MTAFQNARTVVHPCPRGCSSSTLPPRRFVVWAEVSKSKHLLDMPGNATDAECEEACREALDALIGNGDTGWNELHEDGSET